MQMRAVSSTIIQEVGHEGNTLYVKFSNGNTYKYKNVSAVEYQEMLNADSIGKYFIANIKSVKEYEKVGENGKREG